MLFYRESPVLLLYFGTYLDCFLLSLLCNLLFVSLFFLSSHLLLLGSDGFEVTSNEQINEFLPFLVGLKSSSQNLDFSS